jgi:uncharacterized protein involved in exopolysaccharide biosynthesis
MTSPENHAMTPADEIDDDGPEVGLVDLLTWIGERKRLVAAVTLAATVIATAIAFSLPKVYTARTALLPPGAQQQGAGAAAMAALGSLGGLAGLAGISGKTPDELYISLLKSDSLIRALDQRYDLQARYEVENFEALRKTLPRYVQVSAEKKSGVINLEVDDEDPAFAAELANAHVDELRRVLDRLAVSEAKQRRVFFDKQLQETKENLIKAEQNLRAVQEKSGLIVLDKQAEALIGGAAQIRALIAEREVQLKVLRTSATEQNPAVIRLNSELRALRAELARMESAQEGGSTSPIDMPVGRIPAAAIDYVRAAREVKVQEAILETMIRQLEAAKLDEAKEGATVQQIDKALPPDYKSKPSRALIMLAGLLLGLLGSSLWVVWRGYARLVREQDPGAEAAWQALSRAWRWRA